MSMISDATKKLIKICEDKGGETDSLIKAQKYIQNGADITAQTKTGSTIQSLRAQENRLRPVMPEKANRCLQLIALLQNNALDQLAAQIFSADGGNLNRMNDLVQEEVFFYELSKYGPLGIVGALLKQTQVPIRLDVIQFLIRNDPHITNILTAIDPQQQTCLLLAKSNSECPRDVMKCIQEQFDKCVNQILLKDPQIDTDKVKQWIKRGANIEAVDQDHNTVLCNAVKAHHVELVRALLNAGSNIAHKNREGLTPLDLAQKSPTRNPVIISMLVEAVVNLELKYLIETRQSHLTLEEVDWLLKKGGKINAILTDNNTPLHLLMMNRGSPEMISQFVDGYNADITTTNSKGYRPIEICILIDQDPFDRLLAFLKLPKITTDLFYNRTLKKTILQFANEQQRSGAAKIIQHELNTRLWNCMMRANNNDENNQSVMTETKDLVSCGAEIDHRHKHEEYSKYTILHLACKISTRKVVEFLTTDLKADYLTRNHEGDDCICIAATYGHLSIIEYLRTLPDASFNVFNKEGQTPLHLATKNHHFRIVQYLVRWGANPTMQNHSKQIPLDIARTETHTSKEEATSDKSIIYLLEQLVCPPIDAQNQSSSQNTKPSYDLDTCDLPGPVALNPVQINDNDGEIAAGDRRDNMFTRTYNEQLYEAAKDGMVSKAKQAIGKGAVIRFRKENRVPYERAHRSIEYYTTKLNTERLEQGERSRYQTVLNGCQEILQMIQELAYKKLQEAIEKSDANLVMAYHYSGAPLPVSLLKYACNVSKNAEVIDYLVRQNPDMYQAMISDFSSDSPYRIAKDKGSDKLAAYIKYHLSEECTKAIRENNLVKVKKLVAGGASVEMQNTNNLEQALNHGNIEMIQFLCDNGVRMPSQWLLIDSIIFKSDSNQKFQSDDIRRVVNRCLIHRRLRFAAASGDLTSVMACVHLAADIDSKNCHGSTALLCCVQHGNYFRIVHTLVSRGASILHSNLTELPSLIDITQKKSYKQIANYLTQELNTKFLLSIINNDQENAKKYTEQNANVNYQDKQNRTALHYAVQYHDAQLVEWLCTRGSDPTIADSNGDYPITLATEKGDYNTVKYLVEKYPTTKSLKNQDGMTALDIAEKLGYKPIAVFIKTGQKPDVERIDEPRPVDELDPAKLKEACRNGHMNIIEEFIRHEYKSNDEKLQLCEELIAEAKKANSLQILDSLKNHYKQLLLRSHGGGSNVKLSNYYNKILNGFLAGIAMVLANCSTPLDPKDPNTYVTFFSNLNSKTEKQSEDLRQAKTEADVKKLIQNDAKATENELGNLNGQIEEITKTNEDLKERILELDQKLSKQINITANDRKEAFEAREEWKKKLARNEETMNVYQSQQELTLTRKRLMKFIDGNQNLFVFHKRVENSLQILFSRILENQTGYVGKTANNHTIMEAFMSMKEVMGPVLSRLSARKQKKEFHDLSTYHNTQDLQRVALETANHLTLYYREQIELVNPLQPVHPKNIFNDKIGWLKHMLNIRKDISEEKAMILVGDYVTAWVIDGLTIGKEQITSTKSLAQQLWLHVAKSDPINQEYVTRSSSILNSTAGKQKINIISKKSNSLGLTDSIELRKLFGYVSVFDGDQNVYQYSMANIDRSDSLNDDFNNYGYVCVKPFTTDMKMVQSIIEGRKLVPAKQNLSKEILTKFEEIISYGPTLIDRGDKNTVQSTFASDVADHAVNIISDKDMFPTTQRFKEELKTTKHAINLDINAFKESVGNDIEHQKILIVDAKSQIEIESNKNRETMKKDNEIHYQKLSKRLDDQFQSLEKRMEQLIIERMNEINNYMQQQAKEIREVAKTAESQSKQAMEEASRATQISGHAGQRANEAVGSAKSSERLIQQKCQEVELLTQQLDALIRQTVREQKQIFETEISKLSQETRTKLDQAKDSVQKSSHDVKSSEQEVRRVLSMVEDIKRLTEEQLKSQKAENKVVIAEVKQMRQQYDTASGAVQDAEQSAKRIAEKFDKVYEKTNRLQEKIEKRLG